MSIFDNNPVSDLMVYRAILANIDTCDKPSLVTAWHDVFMDILVNKGDKYDGIYKYKLLNAFDQIYFPISDKPYVFNDINKSILELWKDYFLSTWAPSIHRPITANSVMCPDDFCNFIKGMLISNKDLEFAAIHNGIFKNDYHILSDSGVIKVESKYNMFFTTIKSLLKNLDTFL